MHPSEEREAKNKGGKEGRHKEAHTILVVATTVVVASHRISSSRKDWIGDVIEEPSLRRVRFPSKCSHLDDWNNAELGFSGIIFASQPMKVSL